MNEGYSYTEKIIKKENVTDEEYAYIATSNINGIDIKLDWERIYPYDTVFKSILGTVGTIPSDTKDKYLSRGYSISDRVGTSYLELQYDDYLKGEKNKYKLGRGNELELVSSGHRGNDLVLTIDIELQKAVEEILIEEITKAKNEPYTTYYNRSFVLIGNPKTGEVLAMAGKQIINGTIYDYTPGILTSPVVVGSIIKGASQIVGYNTGALKIGETRYDSCIKLRGAPSKCSWKNLGTIDDLKALKYSSNVYQFYTAIKVAGASYFYDMPFNPSSEAFKTYRNTFAEFGLGVKTGIDLPLEIEGYKGKLEKGGLLLDFAIGQYDNYTPIQLLQYMSTIVNDGNRVKPYLLKEVYSYDSDLTKKIFENKTEILNKVNTEQIYIDRVKQGFKEVLDYGGTGSGYIDRSYSPAGKTGTTEDYNDLWFVGYTPYYTCAVWSGYDNNEKIPEDARNFHKNLWKKVMTRIHEGLEDKDFEMPSSVEKASVCSETGLLPRAGCPTITEYFDISSLPTEYCDEHFYGSSYDYDEDYYYENTDSDTDAIPSASPDSTDSTNADSNGDNTDSSDNTGGDNGDSDNTGGDDTSGDNSGDNTGNDTGDTSGGDDGGDTSGGDDGGDTSGEDPVEYYN